MLLAHHDQDAKLMLSVARCLTKNGFAVSIDKQEQLMKDSISMKEGNLMRIQKIFDAVSIHSNMACSFSVFILYFVDTFI